MYRFERFEPWYDQDVLFILEENKTVTDNEFFENVINWQWATWDSSTNVWKACSSGDFSLGDTLLFDNKEFFVLKDPLDRLKYAYASLHNDDEINAILRKHFPTIQDFHIPSMRGTKKSYLKHWMKKYNFTLEDFIFNNKFIVLSDRPHRQIEKMFDSGLIDLDSFKYCSYGDGEKEK